MILLSVMKVDAEIVIAVLPKSPKSSTSHPYPCEEWKYGVIVAMES